MEEMNDALEMDFDGEDQSVVGDPTTPPSNWRETNGWLPIHYAAERNNCEVILKEVKEHEVQPDEFDGKGNTPLQIASASGCLDAVKVLIQLGADINLKTRTYHRTALHEAVTTGMTEVATFLLSQGAKVDIEDIAGQTPLFYCANNGRYEFTKFLVEEFNVDIDLIDRFGETPFSMADKSGMWKVALYLWKVSQRKTTKTTLSTIKTERKLSGTWSRPLLIGEIPEPSESAKLVRSSKGQYFLFGGLIGKDLVLDNRIYQFHFDQKTMSLFSARSQRTLDDTEENDVIRAIQTAQSSFTIGQVGVHLLKQGDILIHNAQGEEDGGNVASAVADSPFVSCDAAFGISYFEVHIVDAGTKSFIAIGLARNDYDLDTEMPGWEDGSYAYHSDDGRVYGDDAIGMYYGPHFTTGDTVGCGLIFGTREIFFTKNGQFLGVAWRGADISQPLFAAVGLGSPKAVVSFNFGKKPFVFQFEVPTIRSTLVGTAEMVQDRWGREFVNDKIYYFTSGINCIVIFDCNTKRISKHKYNTKHLLEYGYEQSAIVDNQIWLLKRGDNFRPVESATLCDDLEVLAFCVLEIDTFKWSSQSAQIHHSLELSKPTSLVISGMFIPVVGNKMYFLNANPPFFLDLATLLAHPIKVPPSYRSTICYSWTVFHDPVSNKEKIVTFGGTYTPSSSTAAWTGEIETKLLDDTESMDNSMLVFDPETHLLSKCPYVGPIQPSSKDYSTLAAVEPNSICLFGGSNGRQTAGIVEIFTFFNESALDDKLVGSFDKEQLHDIKIIAKRENNANKVIFANKIVLYARCAYFQTLLTDDTSYLEIDEPYDILYHLIRYMYADHVSSHLTEDHYYAFIELCERMAPEHLENIAGSLILSHYEYKSLMSSQLSIGFNNPLFSDLGLEIEGRLCICHKAILCARNEYFRAMCLGGLAETGKKRLELHELEYEPFCKAIKYLYEGEARMEEIGDDIVRVLVTARLLGIESLVNTLEDTLCQNVSKENISALKDLAEEQDLMKLLNSCNQLQSFVGMWDE